jgi:ABC-type branched-subunit amino acid transport system substrate-binding protein
VLHKVIAALSALLLTGGLAACGSSNSSGGSAADSGSNSDPLKVVLIPPSSGALAVFGADAAKAWEYAAQQANAKGGVDGHKVVLVKAQTDGQPANTVSAARKAVTQDGAHFIGAVMTSPEHGALQQQLAGMNALSFNGLGKDDALTGASCSPDAFRAVQSSSMDINAITQTLAKLPAKTWAIQAVDYATGHSSAADFTKAAQAAGDKVVMTQYAPLGTTEFGSYITKLKSSGADGLFAVEYGADGVAFVNQGAQFNLFKQFKTVLGFNMVSEPLFPVLKDKIVGFYNNVGYDESSTNPMNKAFVAGFTKMTGKPPYYVDADNYLSAQLLFQGVEKAHSVDPQKVRAALKGIRFNSIVGPVHMGADQQLVRPSYVGQVVKSGNGLAFKVVASDPGTKTHPTPDPACKQ